jgi:glycosyltransferase involved in cell wall biosynthesis
MRISFSKKIEAVSGYTGRYKFLAQLAQQFEKLNVQFDQNHPDIHLYLPSHKPNPKAKVNVLRLDGLCFGGKFKDWCENRKIRKAYKKADAIVFQGQFCRIAYQQYLHFNPLKYACIANGASPDHFLPRQPANYFLANANWRPYKRVNLICDAFLMALEQGMNADLLITGKPDRHVDHPRIKYIGWQDPQQLAVLLQGALASIHAAWIDWCPNSMVEAIVAGCPVVYTAHTGQGELGSGAGWEIPEVPWDYSPCDMSKAPQGDTEAMAQALIQAANNPQSVCKPQLHIEQVARRYLDFFESLL